MRTDGEDIRPQPLAHASRCAGAKRTRGCAYGALAALSIAALGCAHREEPPLGQTETVQVDRVARTSVPDGSAPFDALMSEHFGHVIAARNAMTRGDLGAVQEALTALAEYPYLGAVPGAWLPRVRALQERAGAVARLDTVEALSEGVASIARACGECHQATGGGVSVSVVAREETLRRDTLPDRMFRHDRAAEQLWLGLIAPSDEAWRHGARVLATAPLELEVHGNPPARFTQALHNVRFLGAAAERTERSEDRARVYANLLRACAGCHLGPTDSVR